MHFVDARERNSDGKPDKDDRNGARSEAELCVVPVFSVNSSVPSESHTDSERPESDDTLGPSPSPGQNNPDL